MPRPFIDSTRSYSNSDDFAEWTKVCNALERQEALISLQQASLDRQIVTINTLVAKQDCVISLLQRENNEREDHVQRVNLCTLTDHLCTSAETFDEQLATPLSSIKDESTAQSVLDEPAHADSIQGDNPLARKSLEKASMEVVENMQRCSEKLEVKDVCAASLKRVLDHPKFDIGMGIVIMANLCAMLAQLQLQGYEEGQKLGLDTFSVGSAGSSNVFVALDIIFNSLYIVELVLRVFVYRLTLFRSKLQTLDAILVIVLSLESFVLSGEAVPGLRLLRVLRISRIFKIVRFMTVFTELRVLLQTISWSVGSLGWSLLMLAFIIMASGTLMTQLVHEFVKDESNSVEQRTWLWENFGCVSSSAYVLFEATFTGSWFRYSRYMIEDINPLYAVFWVLYITVVNFAVMRVISALFLKQTMNAASVETLKLQMGKMIIRSSFATELQNIFVKGDENGDGVISRVEFDDMMADPSLKDLIGSLDLDKLEMTALFELLRNDSDEVDYEMLLQGCLIMKSSSPCLDTIQVIHGQIMLKRDLARLVRDVKDIKHWCSSLIAQ
eukprot:TRINITY_DN59315_c0_g1_i1.p1 TRINITY_DN59315_c0_g1~~TRINITY_DN59315_c0_g1_i1.p1  ORF type:complete len:555 (+),score=63.11 TRINITY_DN59315_c0_g1_i1:37-1701(+)